MRERDPGNLKEMLGGCCERGKASPSAHYLRLDLHPESLAEHVVVRRYERSAQPGNARKLLHRGLRGLVELVRRAVAAGAGAIQTATSLATESESVV
jgi:hypothetical protein